MRHSRIGQPGIHSASLCAPVVVFGYTRSHHPPSPCTTPRVRSRSSALHTASIPNPVRWMISSRGVGSQATSRMTSAVGEGRSSTRPSLGAGRSVDPFRIPAVASPTATSTSDASRTTKQPSARSAFVPADAGLRTDPGTAPTVTPRVVAAWTVWSDPPRTWHSTTTSTSERAAMMRFRRGKRHARSAEPIGDSESTAPAVATRRQRPACWRG